jgi:hypothetical protein
MAKRFLSICLDVRKDLKTTFVRWQIFMPFTSMLPLNVKTGQAWWLMLVIPGTQDM